MQCHGVKAEYATVDSHMCEEAHQHGMSLGKYYAIQELLTADPHATLDEFKDKTMKEIKGHTEHCEHRQQRMQGKMWGESPEGSQDESQDKLPETRNSIPDTPFFGKAHPLIHGFRTQISPY